MGLKNKNKLQTHLFKSISLRIKYLYFISQLIFYHSIQTFSFIKQLQHFSTKIIFKLNIFSYCHKRQWVSELTN
jgi:hypothetical protein